MPINPIRVAPPDYPANPNVAPLNFDLGLADLGRNIAANRDRQEVGRILSGAIDSSGNLDWNKAATALAVSGRDPDTYLAGALRQQGLTEAARHNKAIEETARIQAEAARTAAGNRQLHFDPGGYGPGGYRPPGFYLPPDASGGGARAFPVPSTTPAPSTPPPPQTAPGSSALPTPNANVAAFNPEEAAPYRVAGPMMSPPQQVAQAAPAPAPTAPKKSAQDAWIDQNYPDDANTIRGLRDNTIDPYKQGVSKEHQKFLFDVVGRLKPGWSPDQYGERQKEITEGKVSEQSRQKELGTEAGKIEAEAVKSARAAADLQPLLDDVARSWEKLMAVRRFGGIQSGTGFFLGSELARAPQRLLGTEEEKLRQNYEQTLNKLRAQVTAAMNKGEGAVSNYERQLYAAIFPQFTTVDPEGAFANLRQMQGANRQAIELGRGTSIGKQTPGLLAERPAIERPPSADQRELARYQTTPAAALARAQDALRRGVPPDQVRALLNQIDKSGSLARDAGL